MKKYEIDEAFIKEAYAVACNSWKAKIMEKFPEIFKPDSVIGRRYTVNDLSYHKFLRGIQPMCNIHKSTGVLVSEVWEEHVMGPYSKPRSMVEILIGKGVHRVFFDPYSVIPE